MRPVRLLLLGAVGSLCAYALYLRSDAHRHGRRREVRLIEVAPDQRAPIVKAYLARAYGARPHIPVDPAAPVEAFEAIAERYPVFRIEP